MPLEVVKTNLPVVAINLVPIVDVLVLAQYPVVEELLIVDVLSMLNHPYMSSVVVVEQNILDLNDQKNFVVAEYYLQLLMHLMRLFDIELMYSMS